MITGNNTFSDQRGETPLSMAYANGYLEVFKLIIDRNPPKNLGSSPLERAIRDGDLNYCKLVLQYADIKHPDSQGIEFQSVKL